MILFNNIIFFKFHVITQGITMLNGFKYLCICIGMVGSMLLAHQSNNKLLTPQEQEWLNGLQNILDTLSHPRAENYDARIVEITEKLADFKKRGVKLSCDDLMSIVAWHSVAIDNEDLFDGYYDCITNHRRLLHIDPNFSESVKIIKKLHEREHVFTREQYETVVQFHKAAMDPGNRRAEADIVEFRKNCKEMLDIMTAARNAQGTTDIARNLK